MYAPEGANISHANLAPFLTIYGARFLPLQFNPSHRKGAMARDYLIKGIERSFAPFKNFVPFPLMKGRGTKGKGLVNTLLSTAQLWTML